MIVMMTVIVVIMILTHTTNLNLTELDHLLTIYIMLKRIWWSSGVVEVVNKKC